MTREERCKLIRPALIRWFRSNARAAPWRETGDPYRIWVSEVMLQQTRSATVDPYYRRFVRRFPTVRALASADLDDVLRCWEGLGYYARARNLHRAARQVVEHEGGRLPDTAEGLRELPGIGPYTAGAVASIAFGRAEPVLDGNVTRVLCRAFRLREPPKQKEMRRTLWRIAGRMAEAGEPGTVNQALMELGATVCIPRGRRCEQCPISDCCEARRRGDAGELPVRTPRPELPHQTVAVGVIWRRGRILIDKRPPGGLLGGLWELPGGKQRVGEPLAETCRREIQEELGLNVAVGDKLTRVRHAYTHFRVTIHAFTCRYRGGRPRALGCQEWKWVTPRELGDYAFPRANRRILEALEWSGDCAPGRAERRPRSRARDRQG